MLLQDIVKRGTTSWTGARIRFIDSTNGTPETGVAYDTAGIDLWYQRQGGLRVAITEVTLATVDAAYSSGGFIHISDGECRLDLPDAALASSAGVNFVDFGGVATGMVAIGGRIKLSDLDYNDAVRAGLTALPNAAADAAGGLPISDAGGLDLDAIKTMTDKVGTVVNTGGTASIGAILGDFANSALVTRVGEVKTDTAAILVDTGTTLDARIPAALVSGKMDSDMRAATGAGAITSLAYELLLERIYEMINNKMTVNETTGAVALRNLTDLANVATGNVASAAGTTTRAVLTWV